MRVKTNTKTAEVIELSRSLLTLNLFGVFDYRDGRSKFIPLKSRKAEAILLCLALAGEKGFEREYLSKILWPDLVADRAKASLRQAIARLRRVFGDVLISPKTGWIALSTSRVDCDLWGLELVSSEAASQRLGVKWPTEPFLLNYPEPSDIFAEWMEVAKRDKIEHLKKVAISKMSDPAFSSRYKEGVAQTLLLLDHLDEGVVSSVLEFLIETGSSRQYLAVYNSYTSKLESELGLQASDIFIQTYSNIRTKKKHGDTAVEEVLPKSNATFSRPVLTVSNFEVHGSNDELSFLGLGLTEEIIMRLSNQNWFDVNKGDAKLFYSPPRVGSRRPEHLNNAYSVSGAIFTSKNRLRISVKLVEEASDTIEWSRIYESTVDDLFDLQQEIVASISEVLTSNVISAEATLANSLDSELSRDIWVRTMKARYLFWRMNKNNNAKARELLDDVIERSETPSVPAFAISTFIRMLDVWSLWSQTPEEDVANAVRLSERSTRIYPDDPWTYFSLATALGLVDKLDLAIETYTRALTFNPNFAPAIGAKGKYQVFNGDLGGAKKNLMTAIKLNDMDTHYGLWQNAMGIAHYLEGDFDEAQLWADRAISTNSFWAHNYLLSASCYSHKNQHSKAAESFEHAKKYLPDMSLKNLHFSFPFQCKDLKDNFFWPLKKLGLPDT